MGMKPRPKHPNLTAGLLKDLKWIRDQMDLGPKWKCAIEVNPLEAEAILNALGLGSNTKPTTGAEKLKVAVRALGLLSRNGDEWSRHQIVGVATDAIENIGAMEELNA